MKTRMIMIAAVAGLMAMTANPAKAHDGARDFAFYLGPAYVRYRDGYHRIDRPYHRRDAYRHHHRNWIDHRRTASDLWHRCYDGRWYRYYDRKHRRHHERRGRGHKHGHRNRSRRH
jgi:hypothetical protein